VFGLGRHEFKRLNQQAFFPQTTHHLGKDWILPQIKPACFSFYHPVEWQLTQAIHLTV
jgi:hypothetical protein